MCQRNPRGKPECIIALTCKPHVTSSLITRWAAEPRALRQAAAPGRPPVTSHRRATCRSLKDQKVCWEARGGDEKSQGHPPWIRLHHGRHCDPCALFLSSSNSYTPLFTPFGSGCHLSRCAGHSASCAFTAAACPLLPLAGSSSTHWLLMPYVREQLWSKATSCQNLRNTNDGILGHLCKLHASVFPSVKW